MRCGQVRVLAAKGVGHALGDQHHACGIADDGRFEPLLERVAPGGVVGKDGPVPAVPAVAQLGDPRLARQSMQRQANEVAGERATAGIDQVEVEFARGGDGVGQPADVGVGEAFGVTNVASR